MVWRANKTLSILSLLILSLTFSFTAAAQTLDAEELSALKLINDYRVQNGLVPLRVSLSLTKAADWLSADMAARNYFSHTDSVGRDPFVRMTAFGYGFNTYKAENIAAGYDDGARTFNLWKNSASHNANMLNPNYTVIGISRVYGSSSLYRWYWTTDFGGYVDTLIPVGGSTIQTVKTVNAASFAQSAAPDGLAATFGTQLTSTTASAPSLPLPLTLAGITVMVNNLSAPLLYVSPTQINYQIPTNIDPGTAVIKVMSGGTEVANGTLTIETVSPSIFTAKSDGKGVPAAQTTLDGKTFQSVANADGTAKALSVGTTAQPNYLVLYGTGLRRRSSLANVKVLIGGVQAEVSFLGAHSNLVGVDQLNVKLPQAVRGRGAVDVVVTIDGKTANSVTINIGN